MFHNYSPRKIVVLFLVAAQSIRADEALLSDSFHLSIPNLRYQSKAALEQWLWANLQYQPSQDGQILFRVTGFGETNRSSLPALLPLASISDQGPPQITTVNSDSARLTFRASTPLACSVVYGTDRNFGAVATDPNMNGAAVTEHYPLMAGLKPDTDYFYRLQGSARNGNLYWSEVLTFHTPAAKPTSGFNLASLANGASIANVSSNYAGVTSDKIWGANSAIDGSSNTAWSSNGDGNKAFIEINLPKATAINSVLVWSRSMSDGSAIIRSFSLTNDAGQVFGPFSLPNADQAYSFPLVTTTKTLRLNVVDSTGGNTGLIEFGVY